MKQNIAHRIPHTAFRFLLFPFSIIFGMVAALRRKLLHSETFSVPTICVGNLRVGGTGKTPHVEYIAKFLSENHQVAILSRGYGRKTKGYINANEIRNLDCKIIGDEPMQYTTKFPYIEVAVCEKRKMGIEKLVQQNPKLEVVILDDAYQHLSVNYSLRILLTEYHRPFFKDFPLPSGTLREYRSAAKHADVIIVTKCPETLTSEEKADFIQKLKSRPNQDVFFTRIEYAVSGVRCVVCDDEIMNASNQHSLCHFALNAEFHEIAEILNLIQCRNDEKVSEGRGSLYQNSKILLITGIANPTPLVQYLKTQYKEIHSLHFPDHHLFTNKDIAKIIRLKEKLGGKNCKIITTEKDAMRLQAFENMPEYYTIPIEITFLENEAGFKEKLLSLLKEYNA